MFEPRIKIERDLYERLKKAAEIAEHASTDEFILHLLETATSGVNEEVSEEEVKKQLKGLGYID